MGNRLDFLKLTGRRWDGTDKSYTKDCEGCEFYREIEGKYLCGWGVSFKYLIPTDSPRKCEVRTREVDKYHVYSMVRLDEIANMTKNDFWNLVRVRLRNR